MEAILFIIIVGFFDAWIKGNLMARKQWNQISKFWRSGVGMYEPILLIVFLILAVLISLAKWDRWILRIRFYIELLALGFVGFESLMAWWWLKPLNVKQRAFWKEGSPPATWFDYPLNPVWMDVYKLPLWISKLFNKDIQHTTRKGIFCGCGFILFVISLLYIK